VADTIGIARIGQRRVEGSGQSKAAVGLAQEHDPAIAGNIAPLETSLDLTTIKAWKKKRLRFTVCH